MLEYEYMKALAGKFDVSKIYLTKDGRYKTSWPIQVCRKNKLDVLEEVYKYFYGVSSQSVEAVYKAWIADFTEYAKAQHKSWDTVDRYKSDWARFFAGTELAHMAISKVKVSHLKKFYMRLTANRAISRKTLNNAKSLLNRVFDYAIDEDIIAYNPARNVNTGDLICKVTDHSNDIYTNEEREKIINEASKIDNPYTRAIVLMFCTCARAGEIEALKWNDVDFDTRSIYIHSSIRRTRDEDGKQRYIWTDSTKNRMESGNRYQHLSDLAFNALKEQRRKEPFSEFVFMENGHMLLTTQLNRWLKRVCNSAGVKYLSSHKIRFWAITAMVDAGIELTKVQRTAGHANIEQTRHYVRSSRLAAVGENEWNAVFG